MKPTFLKVGKEYAFVPIPDATITFKNNVKVTKIEYPWVLVEHVPQTGERTQPAPVWVNMDLVAVVKVI